LIPEQYKEGSLTEEEKAVINKLISQLKKNNVNLGSMTMDIFYSALKRMVLRRMLSFDVTMSNH
jgi:hypothetical protein